MNNMKIAIIGRSELLYETALLMRREGHQLACVLTAKAVPEYTRTADDYRVLAETCCIPFAEGNQIERFSKFLRDAQADIAISVNYTGVIPQSVIDIFPLGILNAHGGDLPRYRGNACQAWAILNGESRVGLCIHRMIGGELDSGDIIVRDYYPIELSTNITKIWRWMSDVIPHLFLRALDCLNDDPDYVLERQSKDPKDALRCYPRRPEDGRIDWKESSTFILRLINATSAPYSGAYCEYDGKKLVIWEAELIDDDENYCAVPGQILRVGDFWIDVACGEGKLRILNVSLDGENGAPNKWVSSVRARLY